LRVVTTSWAALLAACAAPHASVAPPAPATPAAPSETAAAALPAPAAAPESPSAAEPETPEALHRAAIVVDTHDDVTQRLVLDGVNLGERVPDAQTDIPRMREGGLDAEFLSIFVPPMVYPKSAWYGRATLEFDAIDKLVAANAASAVLARTAAEVRAAAAAGKVAFLIGVEGGHALGEGTDDDLLGRLKVFFDRGARYMTLTWANSNRIGGSSGDDGRGRGLTAFGKRVVARMNDLGMMVDVSHVSDATFFDAVRATRLPVLASHSSARALADRPRNMTDEMLRAVRDNGGAVCVNFGPQFLDAEWAKKLDAVEKSADLAAIARAHGRDANAAQLAVWHKLKEVEAALPPVPAARVIDHIEHIARVAGVDHVCLGSDFDGIPVGPAGLEDVSKFPFVTSELLKRGFSADDVRKVLGENVLRVLEANERGASAPK
jgi:membrane dipeptidase